MVPGWSGIFAPADVPSSMKGNPLFRLSKITDYGVVLLAHLAGRNADADPQSPHAAREVALEVDLPLPVVSKVLKSLARQGLLESHRGSKGGYSLTRSAAEITVSEIVGALEGPVALTECNLGPHRCEHEVGCPVRGPWQVINRVVQAALDRVTLADIADPCFSATTSPLSILQCDPPDLTGRRASDHETRAK